MDFKFNRTHLKKFKECHPKPPDQKEVGHKLDDYLGPSPNNTPEQYEEFCKFIEMLAEKMGICWKPSHAEAGMFSGRKKESEWRRYVISQF